ncbi:uncharacterized protein LOC143277063 [Babylonia areolata]|uniref:uncharacterized protein LOC143277063 n=1 Tax=Babylonia areolata TaxID=304850 RepID=UPI003FD06BE6
MHGTTIMTSSGHNLTASSGRTHGSVTLLMTTHSPTNLLDLQGGSYVTFPPLRCLSSERLLLCKEGFTVSITFRIIHSPPASSSGSAASRVYILDGGREKREASSGMTLYVDGGDSIGCAVLGRTRVWRLWIQRGMEERVWQQLHISWHPVMGLSVWAGVQVLGSTAVSEPRQTAKTITTATTTMRRMERTTTPRADSGSGSGGGGGGGASSDDSGGGGGGGGGEMRLGSEENARNVHIQVSGVSVVETFVTELLMGSLDEFFPVPTSPSSTFTSPTSPTPTTLTTTTSTTTTTTHQQPSESTQESLMPPHSRKTSLRFLALVGQQLVMTSLGFMTSHGNVTLEPVPGGLVLVLDGPGEFLEVGGHSLPCLLDTSACSGGFFFRISFELLEMTTTQALSVLVSSGEGQEMGNAGQGLTLACSSTDVVFILTATSNTSTTGYGTGTTCTALFPASLTPGRW